MGSYGSSSTCFHANVNEGEAADASAKAAGAFWLNAGRAEHGSGKRNDKGSSKARAAGMFNEYKKDSYASSTSISIDLPFNAVVCCF